MLRLAGLEQRKAIRTTRDGVPVNGEAGTNDAALVATYRGSRLLERA